MIPDRISCQFVRPDRRLFEGEVASLVLATQTGELGVWPGHAPEIVVLGSGVVRLNRLEQDGGETLHVLVFGGYAEIDNNTVIILADHARRSDDIDPEVVEQTKATAIVSRDELASDDHRRAYYESKIAWCNLLLAHAERLR